MANPWSEELVYAATDDNIELAGAVISPAGAHALPVSIVWIHGNAANFADRPYALIGRALAAHGYTVVLGNTRGHDIATTLWKADDHSPMAGGGGSGWEQMEDAPRDLAAWVAFATARRPGMVLLAGHSKGAQKVILYAAEHPSTRLAGVALISPDLHGMRIPGELEIARAMVAEGRGMEVVPAQPWAPWYRQSAQTVVSHAEVAERLLSDAQNDGHRASALAAISAPILAAFGASERNAEADLAAIRKAATGATVETAIIAEANHFYDGREAMLAEVIARWAGALQAARTC